MTETKKITSDRDTSGSLQEAKLTSGVGAGDLSNRNYFEPFFYNK